MSLAGIQVVEIGQMTTAPYAARLLADEGADVIKVEPPGGDRARTVGPFGAAESIDASGLFLGLNTNKRSVELDLDTRSGQDRLAQLVAGADVVIHDLSPQRAQAVGLVPDDVMSRHPGLVVCAVTPYGSWGPHAEWRGDELTVVNAGGWASLSPGGVTDPDLPPLKPAGVVGSMQGGLAAAMVTLAALDKAERTGVGDVIDFSVQAHVASMLETALPLYSYRGEVSDRFAIRIRNPWFIAQASDGLIFLVTVEQDQWERLVEMMGSPSWAKASEFADFEGRAQHADALRQHISDWTKTRTVDELFHEGQARRICFAPVFTMGDLEGQAHLVERGFFHTVDQPGVGPITHMGPGARITPEAPRQTVGAPQLNQHGDAQWPPRSGSVTNVEASSVANIRPLAGIRVIDFSWVWAGPFATLQLAHLGADVIKVESSTRPGLGRRLPIHPPGEPITLNTCGYFNQWDQGKRSLDIDLRDPAALEQVRTLIRDADVVVDNFATGVMQRMGLGDDELRTINPDLIIASITGFGHEGPLRAYMGYGPTTAPLAGITSQTGYLGGEPSEVGISFGDPAAGLSAAHAIVSAVVARRRTGVARRIDVSLWEATAVNAIDGWMAHALGAEPAPLLGNRHVTMTPQGCYRCRGKDAWVSIACSSDKDWLALAGIIDDQLGRDPRFATSADRKRHEDELDAIISGWTQSRDRWDVAAELQDVGVAAYPTLDMADLVSSEQLNARSFFVELDHGEVGKKVHAGAPWLMRNSPTDVPRPAPLIGEHNDEILS